MPRIIMTVTRPHNRNQIVPGGKCKKLFPGDADALRKCVENKTLIRPKNRTVRW